MISNGIPMLSCTLDLDSDKIFNVIGIEVEFKIAAYSCSGLVVESLVVIGERYKPFKGYLLNFYTRGRSYTTNGDFTVRYI
jgi:hypothetical protein